MGTSSCSGNGEINLIQYGKEPQIEDLEIYEMWLDMRSYIILEYIDTKIKDKL